MPLTCRAAPTIIDSLQLLYVSLLSFKTSDHSVQWTVWHRCSRLSYVILEDRSGPPEVVRASSLISRLRRRSSGPAPAFSTRTETKTSSK